MIEKKIRSKRDFSLKTYFGSHYLSKGEVKRIRFKNYQTFASQVNLGNLAEADKDEPEAKNLPIILSKEDKDSSGDEISIEDQLVNLPKLKESTTGSAEEIIPELDKSVDGEAKVE